MVRTHLSLRAGVAAPIGAALHVKDGVVKWNMAESPSIAIIIEGHPRLAPPLLRELYGITRRSSVELSSAILDGVDVYSAELFGNDHFEVAPRLEKTVEFCERNSLGFRVEETYDGETAEIDLATMRSILEAAEDYR